MTEEKGKDDQKEEKKMLGGGVYRKENAKHSYRK